MDRVAALRLPAIYRVGRKWRRKAALLPMDRALSFFRDLMARQLVQLLRGIKAADIPVEQPTKFEWPDQPQDREGDGLTVPEALLPPRADKVIE